jgi:RHH-type proline utilization regulon transcriptional repressor/proline dehydrogenase/delta 1-pyrroline-5-carboxylate dehydrogenase
VLLGQNLQQAERSANFDNVGPVIDSDARDMLTAHAVRMAREGTLLARVDLPSETENGTFFAAMAFEIESLSLLKGEVFGPILHVIRYGSDRLGSVIEAINDTGFGLTLGIHSRVDATARFIHDRLKVGNTYVNRTMIGAVVEVQPFGGEGLSDTGPKAGGPHYLLRFATERTLSIDTTAAGGNASLLALDAEAT